MENFTLTSHFIWFLKDRYCSAAAAPSRRFSSSVRDPCSDRPPRVRCHGSDGPKDCGRGGVADSSSSPSSGAEGGLNASPPPDDMADISP